MASQNSKIEVNISRDFPATDLEDFLNKLLEYVDVKDAIASDTTDINEFKAKLMENVSTMDILASFCEGLYAKREAQDGHLSKADEKRWTELLDLMWFVESGDAGSESRESPFSDPISLIKRQEKEGLMGKGVSRKLQRDFLAAVEDTVGVK